MSFASLFISAIPEPPNLLLNWSYGSFLGILAASTILLIFSSETLPAKSGTFKIPSAIALSGFNTTERGIGRGIKPRNCTIWDSWIFGNFISNHELLEKLYEVLKLVYQLIITYVES